MEVSSCPTLPLSWVPNCPVPNCPVSKCPVPSCPVSSCPGFVRCTLVGKIELSDRKLEMVLSKLYVFIGLLTAGVSTLIAQTPDTFIHEVKDLGGSCVMQPEAVASVIYILLH